MDFYNCPYVVVIPFRSGNEYDEDYRCGATGKSCQCCQSKLTPVECEQLFRNRKLAFPREPEEREGMECVRCDYYKAHNCRHQCMELPEGKTCAQSAHVKRCTMIFGAKLENLGGKICLKLMMNMSEK